MCDQNITNQDDPVILQTPTPPPIELLMTGYIWVLITVDGVLSYYYTAYYGLLFLNDHNLGNDPNDWGGEFLTEAKMQGSVVVVDLLWKYDIGKGRFYTESFCSNGGVPVSGGCLTSYLPAGSTKDDRTIYHAFGAVASCPPSGEGTQACGTPGFTPVYQQLGPSLYISTESFVLIVNPLDSGGRLGATQIDLYTGIDGSWYYPLINPVAVWKQVHLHPGAL
jgi:hypothetical protein